MEGDAVQSSKLEGMMESKQHLAAVEETPEQPLLRGFVDPSPCLKAGSSSRACLVARSKLFPVPKFYNPVHQLTQNWGISAAGHDHIYMLKTLSLIWFGAGDRELLRFKTATVISTSQRSLQASICLCCSLSLSFSGFPCLSLALKQAVGFISV